MEELRDYGEYIVLAVLLVEWFLGKTDLVKPGSLIESVLSMAGKVLKLLKPKAK